MVVVEGDLLPIVVVRNIGDKLYEKRKVAALEVEQLIKALAAQGNTIKVGQIIDKLVVDYACSPQASNRQNCDCQRTLCAVQDRSMTVVLSVKWIGRRVQTS